MTRRSGNKGLTGSSRHASHQKGVALDEDGRQELMRLSRSMTAPHRVVLRSRVILALETLGSDRQVARSLRISPRTVRRWRERFAAGGIEALHRDAPGRGRPPVLGDDVDAAAADYLRGARRGDVVPSLRKLARSLGIGLGSAHRAVIRARRRAKDS